MDFQERYDPANPGLKYIFNSFYSIINSKPLHGNMLAVPGEDIERYIEYAYPIVTSCKGKAIFIENYMPRYKRLRKIMDSKSSYIRKKMKLVYGNAECYEMYTSTPKSVRLEDLGIGLGLKYILRLGAFRLMKQFSSCRNQDLWKAQILSGSTRGVPHNEIISMLKAYIACIPGLRMKSINGIPLTTTAAKPLYSTNGRCVLTYRGKNGRTGRVIKHKVEFESNRRSAEFYVYTYINGGQMLPTLLMYK